MAQATINQSYVGAAAYSKVTANTVDSIQKFDPTVPANVAAQTGTLTTRTSDTAGVATLSTGHGVTTGLVDLYWSGGRRNHVTATVSTNQVTFSGGAGDVLPAEDDPITVAKRVAIDPMLIEGDDMSSLMACYVNGSSSTARAILDLMDSGGSSLLVYNLTQNQFQAWLLSSGDTNPLAGDSVAKATVSHDATTAGVLNYEAGQDVTP